MSFRLFDLLKSPPNRATSHDIPTLITFVVNYFVAIIIPVFCYCIERFVLCLVGIIAWFFVDIFDVVRSQDNRKFVTFRKFNDAVILGRGDI